MTISICSGFAQSNSYYPDFNSVYFYNMASVNPGYVPTEGKADFAASHKFRTGPFKDISLFSFAGGRFFRKENGSAHTLRILGSNEQEGPFINTPKAYLNYAYSLQLKEHTSAFAGMAMGCTGIYFTAPSASTSILLPDGALGLGVHHRKISLGAASFQVLNSSATPLTATIRLARYYQFYLNAEKELSIDWKIKGYALSRILPKQKNEVNLAMSLDYLETIAFGLGTKNGQYLSLFGSVFLGEENNRLSISFAYNTSISQQTAITPNSMEISLAYLIR